VSGAQPGSYIQPRDWGNPAVSGRDLIVQRQALRAVASDLAAMAGQLQNSLSACEGAAGAAAAAAGSWHEAQQLAQAMSRAHTGVTEYTGQLRQAHDDMATRLVVSADRYDTAEYEITSRIHAATDPSATIVMSGGRDAPVQPGYGQSWTPQQRAAYYRAQRIENMPGNGGPNWTGTYPITEDASFSPGSTAGYTWQQVTSLLAATDPGAITAAGVAYGQLSATLTSIAAKLAAHGQTLAANWGGSTAVTAVSQVQQLYQTAADMQANTWAAQQALQGYGPVLASFRSSLPKPATSHPADVKAANQAAQQRMAALNSHIETAYYQLPGAVNKNLPPPLAGTGGSGSAGGVAAAGGAGGGIAAAGTGSTTAGRGGYPAGGVPGGAPASGGHGGGLPGGSGPGHPGGAGGSGSRTPPVPGGPPPRLAGSPPPGTTRLAGTGPTGPGVPGSGAGGPGAGGAGPGGLSQSGGAGAGAVPPGGSGPAGSGVLPPIPGSAGSGGSGPGRVPGRTVTEPAPGESGPDGEPAPGELGAGAGSGELGVGVPPGAVRDPVTLSDSGAGAPGAAGEPGLTGESVPVSLAPSGVAGDGLAASDAGAAEAARLPGAFPMTGTGGGGIGQDEVGQGRQYWTSEEEGTWGPDVMPANTIAGADGGATGGGIDGMLPGVGAGGRDEQPERNRLAWLGEDDDFWGAGEPAVPPVIGD
jgi:uncharacterized protein YukE